MKKIIIMALLLVAGNVLTAGNGNENPPCNCSNSDKVDFYGAGQAVWVTNYQIRCDGTTGICWEVKFNGKWVLTIYVEPPMVFDNHNSQDNPPLGPAVFERGSDYVIYQIDDNVWKP